MPDTPDDLPRTGPIDVELLDRIAAHLTRSARFDDVHARTTYAPNSVVADYDLGYLPGGVARAYLRILTLGNPQLSGRREYHFA
jgi:hypothetical protein